MELDYLRHVGLPVGGLPDSSTGAALGLFTMSAGSSCEAEARPPEICCPDGLSDAAASGTSEPLVEAVRFAKLPLEHQAGEKATVLAALHDHGPWHRQVRGLIPKHQIKLSCASSACGQWIGAHLTLHNDFKLVQLGRDYGFPRGFCLVVDKASKTLIGQGTFYPKFANDARNVSFVSKDFGGVDRISCFLKYSGSTGIISVLRGAGGRVVGWTGSSKNSCDHSGPPDGGLSYAAEVVSIFGRHATQPFLQWCEHHRVASLGLEVFIAKDQTHGYGYAQSGFIVTAVAVEGGADGRPVYLSPQGLYQACLEIGLPTDRPILVEGPTNILKFAESLSQVRDLLTLGALRRLLHEQSGIQLETMHDKLVDSEIVEGFVIRRWRGDAEIAAVKFKIWLYQMVTQVLRPCLQENKDRSVCSTKDKAGRLAPEFLQRVQKEAPRWCVASDKASLKLCHWVVRTAARACLPPGHVQLQGYSCDATTFPAGAAIPEGCVARCPVRAYWITLGDHAVRRLIQLMDSVDWDAAAAVSRLQELDAECDAC